MLLQHSSEASNTPCGVNWIGGSGGNSSSQLRTPGNPTEMEAIARVIVEVNASAHTTISDGVVVVLVTRDILKDTAIEY